MSKGGMEFEIMGIWQKNAVPFGYFNGTGEPAVDWTSSFSFRNFYPVGMAFRLRQYGSDHSMVRHGSLIRCVNPVSIFFSWKYEKVGTAFGSLRNRSMIKENENVKGIYNYLEQRTIGMLHYMN